MNLLARKLSGHLTFPSPSLGRRLFYLHSLTALQQCNFHSTKTTATQRSPQFTKPKILKPSGSSSTLSTRIKKQQEAPTIIWPRPGEIPYQAKVANFLKLIGHVRIPVQFESDSDGKHFASTVISLENGGERVPLLIPVMFEGDLAHVVACHVKENDCVFVSGKLSADRLRLASIESPGEFHVVAENLSFVEGFQKSGVDTKTEVPISPLWTDKVDRDGAKDVEEKRWFNVKPLTEKGSNTVGEHLSETKESEQTGDLWRDLVNNPLQWWDYRKHKANGLVKEKFPDFKQKETGEALWVTTAPKWVLPGLGKLECDVKTLQSTHMLGGKRPGEKDQNEKLEESWKNLVENPNNWWDNRAGKKNPRGPDFRHKETREALWLGDSPAWALSRLPPMKGDQNPT